MQDPDTDVEAGGTVQTETARQPYWQQLDSALAEIDWVKLCASV